MAIYTPRGLKIRLTVPYSFALMARLSPRVGPFQVLKTTEGIESVPGLLGIIAALFVFLGNFSPLSAFLVMLAAQVIGDLMMRLGLFIVPGLVMLGTIFSYFTGFGVIFASICVVAFVSVGWIGVLCFVGARITAFFIDFTLGIYFARRYLRLIGDALTESEINFLNAYRFHAAAIGITTDLDLTTSEMSEGHWMPTFTAFAVEWPTVVQRFTRD